MRIASLENTIGRVWVPATRGVSVCRGGTVTFQARTVDGDMAASTAAALRKARRNVFTATPPIELPVCLNLIAASKRRKGDTSRTDGRALSAFRRPGERGLLA